MPISGQGCVKERFCKYIAPLDYPGMLPTRSLVGKEPIDLDLLELALRVLVEAAHPDVADALTVQAQKQYAEGVNLTPLLKQEHQKMGGHITKLTNATGRMLPTRHL